VSRTPVVHPSELRELVTLLAPQHAAALRMAATGADDAAIAAGLGIPVEAVPGVLEVAAAKLARLRREGGI
jgi:hypothetical protein